MSYIDGFVVPVPTGNRDKYIELAREMAEIFKECGAMSVTECWGDDVPDGEVTSFPMAVKLEPGETVCIFLHRLAVAPGSRRRYEEGHGRSAHANGPVKVSVRRQADDLGRLLADRDRCAIRAGPSRPPSVLLLRDDPDAEFLQAAWASLRPARPSTGRRPAGSSGTARCRASSSRRRSA